MSDLTKDRILIILILPAVLWATLAFLALGRGNELGEDSIIEGIIESWTEGLS